MTSEPQGITAPGEPADPEQAVGGAGGGRSIAQDSLLLFAMQLVGNAGLFVSVLLLARALGPSGRGTMAFITVTALLVGKVSKLGLSQATTVFAAQRESDRAVLLSNLVVFSLLSSLGAGIVVALALALLPGVRPAGVGGTELVILVFAVTASSLWDEGFLLGCGRLRQLAVRAASGGWIYALLLGLIWIGPGLTVTSAAVAWTLGQLIVGLMLYLAPARELGFVLPRPRLLEASIRFGLRAWVGSVSILLNSRFDQMLMGFITTEATLGIYAVSVNASEPLLYLPTAIATTILPTIARTHGSGLAVGRTLRTFRMTILIALATMAVAAAAGPLLLPIVFGEPFRPSITPFLWLLPGVLGYAAMSLFSNALLALSSPGLSSFGPLASLVTSVILDVTLIPPFGAAGAAIAATAAFTAGGAIAVTLYRSRVGFDWRSLIPRGSDARAVWELGKATRRMVLAR